MQRERDEREVSRLVAHDPGRASRCEDVPAYEIAPSPAAIREMRKRLYALYPENARRMRPRDGILARRVFAFALNSGEQLQSLSYLEILRQIIGKHDPISSSVLMQIVEAGAEKDGVDLRRIISEASIDRTKMEILSAPTEILLSPKTPSQRGAIIEAYRPAS